METRRVLIVEDDPLISSHLESIVTRTAPADVVISTSVAEALEAANSPLDFALLDVDVLDGTTYAVASKLKTAAVPFGFVSASKRENVPPTLREVPFVAKPYTDQDITTLLQTAGKAAFGSET